MTEIKLSGYELLPYKIRLAAPWQTATQTLLYREGILLTLHSLTGQEGTGECAPLPSIGTETLQAARQYLNNILSQSGGQTVSQLVNNPEPDYPAANFSLETALLDLQAKQQHTSMARLINPHAATEVRVNTMLGHLDSNILNKATQAENRGFRVLKIKMGIYPLAEELSTLELLIEQLQPQTRLRLDANQAWNIEQSINMVEALDRYAEKIDSLEEPLKTYNVQQYRELQHSTTIPLALDESFSLHNIITSAWVNFPVRRLIIKPMAIGSLLQSYRIAQLAQQQSIDVIITSSIETGHGLRAITHLAAAINNHQTHGLATGSWLQDTLIPAPVIHKGIISLSL